MTKHQLPDEWVRALSQVNRLSMFFAALRYGLIKVSITTFKKDNLLTLTVGDNQAKFVITRDFTVHDGHEIVEAIEKGWLIEEVAGA